MPLNDFTIVCFGSVDWSSHHQRPQAIASALETAGADVIYVNNLGIRLPRVRDVHRVAMRFRGSPAEPASGVLPGVRRVSPLVVPLHHVLPIRRWNERKLIRHLRPLIEPGRKLIVWTYLPVPSIRHVADALDAKTIVFDWVDDLSERVLTPSTRHRSRIARWENDMARVADVVFVTSDSLHSRARNVNNNTLLVPHGVTAFDPSALSEPGDLAAIPKPRVGFVGSISEWTDVRLLEAVAKRRPDWSIVLIGTTHISIDELTRLPNVHHLGHRTHTLIPNYLSGIDVGLMPYVKGPAVDAASPLKLREYLEQGLPVVSTDLPAVRELAPRVTIARGPDGFIAGIDEALCRGKEVVDPGLTRMWSYVVAEMGDHIQRVIEQRR